MGDEGVLHDLPAILKGHLPGLRSPLLSAGVVPGVALIRRGLGGPGFADHGRLEMVVRVRFFGTAIRGFFGLHVVSSRVGIRVIPR
jgi:hypothetical protein